MLKLPLALRTAWLYRRLVRQLAEQNRLLARIADTLDRMAPPVRVKWQQATDDQSGVSYVDDREASVLEQVQKDLAGVLGREPTPEEILDAFEGKA